MQKLIPSDNDGCWNGLILLPRVIINLACAESLILLIFWVSSNAVFISFFERLMFISIALQPSNSLSKCSSKNTHVLFTNLIPSQMPSPRRNPLSSESQIISIQITNLCTPH